MRQAGEIADRRQAERFVRFLGSRGVEATVREGAAGVFGVWIIDETHVAATAELFRAFVENPNAPIFEAPTPPPEAKPRKTRTRYVDARTEVFGRSRGGGTPLIYVLIGLSCALTWFYLEGDRRTVAGLFMFSLPAIEQGQVWRIITPIFLHSDLIWHLAFNMIWLYQLGGAIERTEGTLYTTIFIVAVAAAANMTQFVWDGPGFLGMSGVVYGVFGYVWIMSRFSTGIRYGIDRQSVVIMLVWLVLCGVGIVPNVANADHVGGLVAGMLWGFVRSGHWRVLLRRSGLGR